MKHALIAALAFSAWICNMQPANAQRVIDSTVTVNGVTYHSRTTIDTIAPKMLTKVALVNNVFYLLYNEGSPGVISYDKQGHALGVGAYAKTPTGYIVSDARVQRLAIPAEATTDANRARLRAALDYRCSTDNDALQLTQLACQMRDQL